MTSLHKNALKIALNLFQFEGGAPYNANMLNLRPWLTLFFLCTACVAASPEPVVSSPAPTLQPTDPGMEPPLPEPMPASPNLIHNGDVELQSAQAPEAWTADHWGSNLAMLSWKNADAPQGNGYLHRELQNHESGDAKWIFDALPLVGDRWYEYSDLYRSDGRNRLIISCQDAEGKRFFHTLWQTHIQPQWGKSSFRFYGGPYAGCQASVMHVLDRNGFLDTDAHQLQVVAAQPLRRALVSVTFDDIWKTVITEGLKPLNERGWKGSFYVTRRFAELATNPEYAKTKDIQQLIQQGHEVGSHSDVHPLMSTLDVDDVYHELENSYHYLEGLGQTPEGIAYPFGDFSAAVERQTQRFYGYARTSLVGLNDKSLNRFRLRIVPVTQTSTTAELKQWVDFAKASQTWLIFLFHDLSNTPGDFEYTTSLQQYKDVLQYVADQEVAVLPVHAALKEALAP